MQFHDAFIFSALACFIMVVFEDAVVVGACGLGISACGFVVLAVDAVTGWEDGIFADIVNALFSGGKSLSDES